MSFNSNNKYLLLLIGCYNNLKRFKNDNLDHENPPIIKYANENNIDLMILRIDGCYKETIFNRNIFKLILEDSNSCINSNEFKFIKNILLNENRIVIVQSYCNDLSLLINQLFPFLNNNYINGSTFLKTHNCLITKEEFNTICLSDNYIMKDINLDEFYKSYLINDKIEVIIYNNNKFNIVSSTSNKYLKHFNNKLKYLFSDKKLCNNINKNDKLKFKALANFFNFDILDFNLEENFLNNIFVYINNL